MKISEQLKYFAKNKPRVGIVESFSSTNGNMRRFTFALGQNMIKLNSEQIKKLPYSENYKFGKENEWICIREHVANVELTIDSKGNATLNIPHVSLFGQKISTGLKAVAELSKNEILPHMHYLSEAKASDELPSDLLNCIFSKIALALPGIINETIKNENKCLQEYIQKSGKYTYDD